MRSGRLRVGGHRKEFPQPSINQTCWLIVPLGFRLPAAVVTNRPVEAERVTARVLLVPAPTRSVVVLPGHLATVALETNRPLIADRFTLAISVTSEGDRTRRDAALSCNRYAQHANS